VAAAGFQGFLGNLGGNTPSNEEIFQKITGFYKIFLCNRKKMGYNKKKKSQAKEIHAGRSCL